MTILLFYGDITFLWLDNFLCPENFLWRRYDGDDDDYKWWLHSVQCRGGGGDGGGVIDQQVIFA